MKRNEIITNENGKYELTDELPNDVRLTKMELYYIYIVFIGIIFILTPWNYNLVPSLPPKIKILSIPARNY